MKPYKVTYYDGKGKKNLFVKANSSNQAVAEAKERLRTNKVIGATIVGAERTKFTESFNVLQLTDHELRKFDEVVEWTKHQERRRSYHQPIRNPKHIECLIKGKEYKYGKGRTH